MACAELSLHLKDGGCNEGAVQVADLLFSFLVAFSDNFQLDESVTKAFFKLVLILETDPSTSSQQRVDSLVILFSRLASNLQNSAIVVTGQIVRHLGPNSSASVKEICKRLCGILPSTIKLSSVPLEENIVQEFDRVVNVYLQLEELNLLQMLVKKICSFDSPDGRNRLIQKILSSKENWSLLSSSKLGRELIHQLLLSRIAALSANTNLENFRRSLFCCLLHVIQLDEIDPSFALDPLRIKGLKKFLEEILPIESVCRFINDLRYRIPPILSPPIVAIITSLAKNVEQSYGLEKLIISNYKLVFETVFIFARAGQLDVIVESICSGVHGTCGPSNKAARKSVSGVGFLEANTCTEHFYCRAFEKKISLLKDILTVGSIWSTLSASSRNLVRENCYDLISTRFLQQEDRSLIDHEVYDQFEEDIVSCISLVLVFEERKPISINWVGSRQLKIHVYLLRTVRYYFIEGRGIEAFHPNHVRAVLQYLLWLGNYRQDLQTLPLVSTFIQNIVYADERNEFLPPILSSAEIEQLVTTAKMDYRLAFCRLIDERISQLVRISTESKDQEVAKLEALRRVLKFNGPPAKKPRIDSLP